MYPTTEKIPVVTDDNIATLWSRRGSGAHDAQPPPPAGKIRCRPMQIVNPLTGGVLRKLSDGKVVEAQPTVSIMETSNGLASHFDDPEAQWFDQPQRMQDECADYQYPLEDEYMHFGTDDPEPNDDNQGHLYKGDGRMSLMTLRATNCRRGVTSIVIGLMVELKEWMIALGSSVKQRSLVARDLDWYSKWTAWGLDTIEMCLVRPFDVLKPMRRRINAAR